MSPADVFDAPVVFQFADPATGVALSLKLSGRIIAHEIELERSLQDKASRVVQRQRALVPLVDYQILWKCWLDSCTAGEYAFGNKLCWEWINLTKEGWIEDVFLHFKRYHETVTRELVAAIWDDEDRRKELEEIKQRVNDPNRRARPGRPRSGQSTGSETSSPNTSSPS